MSVNPGCSYNNCTLPNGAQVSVVNVTVKDNPEQTDEQHWIWSVIGRPTVQTAITPPDAIASIDWKSIFLNQLKINLVQFIKVTQIILFL